MEYPDSQGAEFCLPVNQSFDPETGYIVANVAKVDYPFIDREVLYQGRVFQPKSELHITIISADDAQILSQYLKQHPENVSEVWEIIDETDWSFRKLDELYLVEEKPGVETIIQSVELPGLDPFLRSLSQLCGKGFIQPPTHVTLYTRGTEKGIGLPSQRVFDERIRAHLQPADLQVLIDDNQAGPEQGLL